MSWWKSRRSIDSTKNGRLDVVTTRGKTAVMTDGIFQSGGYMQAVFRGMLRLLPKAFVPKRILLLGLGAGGCIPVIRQRFPKAHIVAVEYDPAMIALARETYLKAGDASLELIQADAREATARMQGAFDLILVDLFHRRHVATVVSEGAFLQELDRLLAWQGYLLVNLFREFDAVSPVIEKRFVRHERRRIRYNEAGMYRHRGMGKMGEGAPEGFEDREQSLTWLRNVGLGGKRNLVIDDGRDRGSRLLLGPFAFDRFVQAHEPSLQPLDKFRIVSWQPYAGTPPRGWWRIPGLLTTYYKRGYAILTDRRYWEEWSGHAKRHRDKFLRSPYEVVEVDLPTFSSAYHATRFLDPLTRRTFLGVLRHHLDRHHDDVHLSIAREPGSGRIVSGLATIDYADISLSSHVIAFVHPDAQRTSVGVGLIDRWHARCLEQGIRFLDFGILRRPREPRSWQGYTNFKRQFHLYEILYPRPVFRIVWPKRLVV